MQSFSGPVESYMMKYLSVQPAVGPSVVSLQRTGVTEGWSEWGSYVMGGNWRDVQAPRAPFLLCLLSGAEMGSTSVCF